MASAVSVRGDSFRAAIKLCDQALELANSTTPNSARLVPSLASIIPAICEHDGFDSAIDLVASCLDLQARLTAAMRPSQRERSQLGPHATYTYYLGRYSNRATVSFPPPSGYFDVGAITVLHALLETAKRNDQVQLVQQAVDTWANGDEHDPYLRFVHLMAKASVEYWTDQPQAALATLEMVDALNMGSQLTSLVQARMRYDSGDVRGALATIEKLRPSNQKMLVDRELTMLQLVVQLGDLERARKSAQKLFALRLDSATEFKLADLMNQLGMRELGDRMMSRIRRRAGGKQDTLVQLMQRYSSAGDNEAAAEMARQIVRRTQPSTSSRSRTSSSVQHQQALQVLVNVKQIEPLIQRFEQLVERSPKSSRLVNQLAAAYEAAGRRSDAQALRLKSIEQSRGDPQSLLAAAQQLAASGANNAAVDKYLELVRRSPELMYNSYYDMRDALRAGDNLPKLAELMIEIGVEKFGSRSRIDDVCYELVRANQFSHANKLLEAVVASGDWYSMGRTFVRVARGRDFKLSPEVSRLVADKLCEDAVSATNVRYLSAVSPDGKISGLPDQLIDLVSQDEAQSKRVADALLKQINENEHALFPRVCLCLLRLERQDVEGAQQLLKPLLDNAKSDRNAAQALWSIASRFVDESPESTIEILTAFDSLDPMAFGYGGMGSDLGPRSLLIKAYENAGDKAQAKRMLLQTLQTMKIDTSQDQYNPGYGAYQYISSMDRVARRLIDADAPAEAFIAYRKAYGDAELLKQAEPYGGNRESRAAALNKTVQNKMTPDVVLNLVQAAAGAGQGTSDVAIYLTSVETSGSTMSDARVAIPLEQFVAKLESGEELRQRVASWLESTSLPDTDDLPTLVSRLVISRAVDNAEATSQIITAIAGWNDSNPHLESKSESQLGDEYKAALEQELVLAIAAKNLPESPEYEDLYATWIDRAIKAATKTRREQIAFGLRCELANRIAADDRSEAEKLFMQALDDLLPTTDSEQN